MDSIKAYNETLSILSELPFVKALLKENKKLNKKYKRIRDENKSLRNLIHSIPEFRCGCNNFPKNVKVKTENENNSIPVQCEPLTDDDVVFVEKSEVSGQNIVIIIDSDEEADDEEADEEADEEEADEEEADEEETEEEADEEADEEEAEEEADEEAEEETEEEADEEAEEEEAEEETEEEAESTVEVEEEGQDVFEVTIKNKTYYTTNEKNGTIYAIESDESVGDEIGVFIDGKAKFHKK